MTSNANDGSERPIAEEAAAIAGEDESDPEVVERSPAAEAKEVAGGDESTSESEPADAPAPPEPPGPGPEQPADVDIRGQESPSESRSDLEYPYTSTGDVDEITVDSWGELFPYDQPYDDQEDAISKLISQIDHDAFGEGGVSLLEAACGTGKTLAALCAGVSAVRDPSTPYERVMVATSVHQQLRAFEDDLGAINEHLPDEVDPVSAISMVGKSSLCAYTDSGVIDERFIYSRCNSLRDPVRLVAQTDSAEDSLTEMSKKAQTSVASASENLSTDEWTAPYHEDIPSTGDDSEYCPFYAKFRAKKAGDDLNVQPNGVVRPWDLMQTGAEAGMCPHALLLEAIGNAEVTIGNYKHVFNPVTVEAMTGELMGPETILVADEAHNLISEARNELSDSVAHTTIQDAIDEIRNVILELEGEAGEEMRRGLSAYRLSEEDLEEFADFLSNLLREIRRRTVDKLDAMDQQWHDHPFDLPEEMEVNLREPDEPERDELTEWMVAEGYEDLLEKAAKIQKGIEEGFEEAKANSDFQRTETYSDTVARVLKRWWQADHEEYFRQLHVEQLSYERSSDMAFEEHFTAHIKLRNCIPEDEIASRLDNFGSSILMSATLEPLDVYQETVGADKLREDGRDVQTLTYGLSYPEENRYSAAVPLTKFTSRNRGSPEYGDDNEVRDEYAATVRTVATSTPGNVLVAMPSYAEAKWIADRLSNHSAVSKPVEADGSDVDTEELKKWFFNGDGKIVATGVRGTLTEGVDFDGDKLAACITCGVPLRDLRGDHTTAIETAYEHRYGSSNGFEYAFTVPAIRKTRQALGRVIRGDDEVGVRVLADRRYASDSQWDDVREHLPQYERDEYTKTPMLEEELSLFWSRQD